MRGPAGGTLEACDVHVTFGGYKALDGVSVSVAPGRIVGLIGPNGAGKTTLFNAFTGLVKLREGSVRLDGRDITSHPPHRRARAGISRTYQRLELFGSLTVRENVLVAAELQRRRYGRRAEINAAVEKVIADLQLESVADAQAETLSTGNARRLEVARAIASRSRFLLLDEPSAGLDPAETEAFRHVLLQVSGSGVGVLLVEHDIGLVMSVSSHVYVLDFGRLIADGSPEAMKSSEVVARAYIGTVPAAGSGGEL